MTIYISNMKGSKLDMYACVKRFFDISAEPLQRINIKTVKYTSQTLLLQVKGAKNTDFPVGNNSKRSLIQQLRINIAVRSSC